MEESDDELAAYEEFLEKEILEILEKEAAEEVLEEEESSEEIKTKPEPYFTDDFTIKLLQAGVVGVYVGAIYVTYKIIFT